MQFSQQEGSDPGITEGESNAAALSTSEQKCEHSEGGCQLFCSNTVCAGSGAASPWDTLSSASAKCWERVLGD